MFTLFSSLSAHLPSNCWLLIALSWDTSLCSKTASCYHCCKEWLFGVSQYTYRCNLVLSALIAKGSYYILVECAQLSMIVIQVPSQFCRARFRSGCPAIAPSPYQPTIYYLCRSQLEEASVIFSLPVIIVCLYGLIHLQGVHFEANELPLLCVWIAHFDSVAVTKPVPIHTLHVIVLLHYM